jgi:hypothetical protein
MQEVKWVMDYLDRHPIQEIDDAVETLQEWASQTFGYESKNQRIREWDPSEQDFYNMVCHIFAGALLAPQGMTYQAMIGYIAGKVACVEPLDRAKCAAEVIAICYLCELIVITRTSDKTMVITTELQLMEPIPAFARHLPEFSQPEQVWNNPILGNRFKQHGEEVCIDHINRMNAIPLCLESRIITLLPETTNEEWETQEQVDQWEKFVADSMDLYQLILSKGNRFHLLHSYDTRGRCYCSGYHVNYQGSSYKKAIVQLAEKEIVRL